MGLKVFNADSIGESVRVNLDIDDDLYITKGTVVAREDAFFNDDYTVVTAGSYRYVKLEGTIAGGSGIRLGHTVLDGHNTVKIGAAGSIMSFLGDSDAIHIVGHDATIENAGTIWSRGRGILVGSSISTGQITIENTGTIESHFGAAIHRHDNGTQPLFLSNSGLISGKLDAFRGANAEDQITNTGRIEGRVFLLGGDDLFDGTSGIQSGPIYGGAGEDSLLGGAGADKMYGNEDLDILRGGGGNDCLDGGLGADRMFGGTGHDTYGVDNAKDIVDESGGTGTDTVFSAITYTLPFAGGDSVLGAIENLTLINVASAVGGGGNNLANAIIGNDFNNTLSGRIGADKLHGMNGNDTLNGNEGTDTLTGGMGNDTFYLNSLLYFTNRDVITDFANVAGNNDRFCLENNIMTKLGGPAGSTLNPAFFRAGTAAADANDYIIYNRATGSLGYDANGNGLDGSITLATLTSKPLLTAADFIVI